MDAELFSSVHPAFLREHLPINTELANFPNITEVTDDRRASVGLYTYRFLND